MDGMKSPENAYRLREVEERRSVNSPRVRQLTPDEVKRVISRRQEGISWDVLSKQFGISERRLQKLVAP